MNGSTKTFLLAAAAAVSLLAASGAHAGAVISDQRYWTNEVARAGIHVAPSPLDAMASLDTARATNTVMYRGGPKTGTR
jgi:hypothetical protein